MKPRSAEKALKALVALDRAQQYGYREVADTIITALNTSFNAGYRAARDSAFLLDNPHSAGLTSLIGIPWARWQWDLLTGCTQGCVDCPARAYADAAPAQFIADKEHFDQQGASRHDIFAPCRHADVLRAPFDTPTPRSDDPAYFRVLTCWYSDIFDAGIAPAWRDDLFAVIRQCAEHGKPWRFLLRTCQPNNLPDLDWPENVELCLSVTRQMQVADAEAVMKKLRARQPTIPVNLLYDPGEAALRFSTLQGFGWLYLGSLPGAPARDGARHLSGDECYALRAQAALAGCAYTRSPGIRLARLDELSARIKEENPADIVRALCRRMKEWM